MEPYFESTSRISQRLRDYWQLIADGRPMPARADMDPGAIASLLPNILLLDVTRDPLDFSYRLIGTAIVERSQHDYTGMRVMDIPLQRRPSRIWSLYEDVVRTGQPLCTHIPYRDEATRHVEMQALPLSDDGKTVNKLLGSVVFDEEASATGIKAL